MLNPKWPTPRISEIAVSALGLSCLDTRLVDSCNFLTCRAQLQIIVMSINLKPSNTLKID